MTSDQLSADQRDADQPDDDAAEAEELTPSSVEAAKTTITEPIYVVGIGASAGGLEALETLFADMPLRTGMAFVIIQHLSPDYKSMMDELLARKTMIPIKVAEDQMLLEADTIFLLPPKKEMIAANGRLYLTERENTDSVNLPINTFFRSMAETYQDKSIAIVLSGTGSDGSKGVPLVHDRGGFVIAQEPASCKFSAMPENAIRTHNVDLIVAPEDIPGTLIKYSHRTAKVEQHLLMRELDAEVGEFSEILLLINNRFNLDFSQYKPSTISRRLERRLAMQKTSNLRDYINVLLSNQEELETLYYDLLIGVTRFFRDSTAFSSLRVLMPKLLEAFKDEPEIRVWVAACATGQEAYSTAMLLVEAMENDPNGEKPFKVFATDIHNKSIQTAAVGIYSEAELEDVSEERKKRFFTLLPTGKYQVGPEIRKPIVFAQHNLLKDPPFTRTHLVNCRNLLIYFNNSAQQRVLSLLTFSLMNQGLLFLGPSEAIGNHASDYVTVDSTYRIFRKTRDSQRRLNIPMVVREKRAGDYQTVPTTREGSLLNTKSRRAQEVLLQRYVPASVLIDESGAVLHVFGDAGSFLSITPGTPSNNIRSMLGGQAKTVVTQLIHHIGKNRKPMKSRAVQGFTHHNSVDIEMAPLSELPGDLDYIIVSFRQTEVAIPTKADNLVELTPSVADSRTKELEEELQFTQESLQSTVEELETSNEELQASNEELMASNEELQSTNEELQSVNEELSTVNAEFQQKEIERSQLMADERSINIGILFLDEELRVRKMSPEAARLFNLIESDYGRPVSKISGGLMNAIQADIFTVFQGGELIEREITAQDGSVHLMRISAHLRDEVAAIEASNSNAPSHGVVLTFSNISKQNALVSSLQKSQVRFNETLNAIADGYFEWSLECGDVFFSQELMQQLGYTNDQPGLEALLGEHSDKFKRKVNQAVADGTGIEDILPFINHEGETRWMICKGRALVTAKGAEPKFTGILIDFSQQKEVENTLHRQASDLERSNKLLEQFAYIVSHDMKAPLRHIQSYLGFLQEAIDEGDAEAIRQEMQALADSTDGLGELIDDIITYSRVNAEKRTFAMVDINAIVESTIHTLSPVITEKNITVKHSELPTLNGDKNLLQHLFQNLIGNACKYNDKANPQITISHEETASDCTISVRDNGVGFDQKYADRIFAPFQRLFTKEQYEGTGIGLSICKTVVEQHQGSISVTSALGEGACFSVTLPKA
ncbi:MAG: chemotaxis protein CheB [Granulosicoccus sp.]